LPGGLAAQPASLGLARRSERAVAIDNTKGVEPRLQRVEAIEKQPGHLDRRQRPLAVKLEQRYGRGVSDIFFACHRSSVGCDYPLISAGPQRGVGYPSHGFRAEDCVCSIRITKGPAGKA